MLKIITFITSDYIHILNDYFLATLPEDVDDIVIECVNKRGYFRSDPYSQVLERIRTGFIIDQISSNMGQNLMMVDADVVFNKSFKADIEKRLETNDILFQENEGWYNFGVFALKCTEQSLQLFKGLLGGLQALGPHQSDIHDQHIINQILNEYHKYENTKTFKHSALPITYFGGHLNQCKYPLFPQEECYLYHATNTYSLVEKKQVLDHVKHKFTNKE